MIQNLKRAVISIPGARQLASILTARKLHVEHEVKQKVINEWAGRYHLKILVETGTYRGDMLNAMKTNFSKLFSIELSADFAAAAQKRFSSESHIQILHGDSSVRLAEVLNEIEEPALFWLDGHYSGGNTAKGDRDTPVLAEVNQILQKNDLGHVILIDDARLFGTDPEYPTVEEIKRYVAERRDMDFSLTNDILVFSPKSGPAR